MMITDRWAETPRTTMDHEPEPVRLIRLQLDEMIAAPNCGELQDTRRVPECFEPRVTERRPRKIAGHRDSPSPVSSPSRDQITQPPENLAGNPRFANCRHLGIKRNRQHAAANIPADSLRIQELRCGD